MITKKKFIGYFIKYRYIDNKGYRDYGYKHCKTMLEVTNFIDELKAHYGEKLKAVFLETDEELEF